MSEEEFKNYSKFIGIIPSSSKSEICNKFGERLSKNSNTSQPQYNNNRPKSLHNVFTIETNGNANQESKIQCICNSTSDQSLIQCTKCGLYQHIPCIGNNKDISPYKCPCCIITYLDPLVNVTRTLLYPILAQNIESVSEQLFKLSLSTGGKKQIFIRCIKLDGKSNEWAWPLRGQLQINKFNACNFALPKENQLHRRQDSPYLLQIGQNCIPGCNRIALIKNEDYFDLPETQQSLIKATQNSIYVAAVVEAECLTPEELVRKIITTSKPILEESRKIFVDKLHQKYASMEGGDDCICEESTLTIPLSDPYLPHCIMNIPVYGKQCKHIQSFDLLRYLKMNERAKIWKCPYCGEKCFELVVDTHMELLLTTLKKNNIDFLQIWVEKNGIFKMQNGYLVGYRNGNFQIFKKNMQAEKIFNIESIGIRSKKEANIVEEQNEANNFKAKPLFKLSKPSKETLKAAHPFKIQTDTYQTIFEVKRIRGDSNISSRETVIIPSGRFSCCQQQVNLVKLQNQPIFECRKLEGISTEQHAMKKELKNLCFSVENALSLEHKKVDEEEFKKVEELSESGEKATEKLKNWVPFDQYCKKLSANPHKKPHQIKKKSNQKEDLNLSLKHCEENLLHGEEEKTLAINCTSYIGIIKQNSLSVSTRSVPYSTNFNKFGHNKQIFRTYSFSTPKPDLRPQNPSAFYITRRQEPFLENRPFITFGEHNEAQKPVINS